MKIDSNLGLSKQQFSGQKSDNLENKFKDLLKKKEEAIAKEKSSKQNIDLDKNQAIRPSENQEVDEDVLSVSQQFESIFVGMMFKQMRDSIDRSDLLHGGLSQDIFEDMYYDEISDQAAKNGDFGIAEAVYRQLTGEELK